MSGNAAVRRFFVHKPLLIKAYALAQRGDILVFSNVIKIYSASGKCGIAFAVVLWKLSRVIKRGCFGKGNFIEFINES